MASEEAVVRAVAVEKNYVLFDAAAHGADAEALRDELFRDAASPPPPPPPPLPPLAPPRPLRLRSTRRLRLTCARRRRRRALGTLSSALCRTHG